MTVETVRGLDSSLVAEWDDLAESLKLAPWSRPGWLDTWLQAFGGGSLVAFCFRRRGKLTGVLPMLEDGRRLNAPVNDETPDFGPVTGDGATAQELWAAAFEQGFTWVSIPRVPGSPEFLKPLITAATRTRRRVVQRSIHGSPYLDIRGDWESFEGSLSANWRQSLRRRRRQLEKMGRVDIDVYDGTTSFEDLFDEGLRIEPSGWKREAGSALIADERARNFYESMAKWAAGRGWLRLVFLRLDGRAIAFRIDLETGDTYYHLKGGYDPEFGNASPGNVLAAAVIKGAFDRGLERFEFLGASEPHKLKWTQTARDLRLVRAFDRSMSGTLGFWLYRYVRPVVARLRS